jgi:hypothetical protein
MSTEVFTFDQYEKFAPAPQTERGLRNLGKTRVVSVFSRPVYTIQYPVNNADLALSAVGSSSQLSFILGSSGYLLTWDGHIPKICFTLSNTGATDVIVNPSFMFERASVYINNSSMSSHFTNPWAYARDRVMDTPVEKLMAESCETGLPVSGFLNRPFLPSQAKASLDIQPTAAGVVSIASLAAQSPQNPGLIPAGTTKTFALPLDDVLDGLFADKDSIPIPLKYMTLRLDFIMRPTSFWSWEVPAIGTDPITPTLTMTSPFLRYYRCELPSDLDSVIRGYMERGLLNIHTFCCATQSIPIEFSASGNRTVQITSLPRSVRFVNQHIEAPSVESLATTAYKGLTSLDFGITRYQHVADSNVIEDYPVDVKSTPSAFIMSEDCAYLRKRAMKEYSKIHGTCLNGHLYSGINGQGTGAVGYYPTCNSTANNFDPYRTALERVFRISADLGSANEDVYSGTEIKTSLNTTLWFGADAARSGYFSDTSTVAEAAMNVITAANLVHLLYANAEVTLGLTTSQLTL